MSTKKEEDGWDSPENEVKSNWMKFNVPLEDKIFGTLIDKRVVKSNLPGKEGEPSNVYDIKALKETLFHVVDDAKKVVEEPVHIHIGDIYSVSGTAVIDRQMKNIRKGQIIGLKFIEEKPSKTKGFAPAKVIKVFAPKNADGTPQVDQEFMDSLDREFD